MPYFARMSAAVFSLGAVGYGAFEDEPTPEDEPPPPPPTDPNRAARSASSSLDDFPDDPEVPQMRFEPVSYTHLTLPTILLV